MNKVTFAPYICKVKLEPIRIESVYTFIYGAQIIGSHKERDKE